MELLSNKTIEHNRNMKKLFSDICKEAAEIIRESGAISSISEVSGTYTVVSSVSVDNLNVNQVIYFTNTPTYTNDYRILSVDSNTNSFTFRDTTGKQTGTVGEWNAESPYFDFGTWKEFIRRLTENNEVTLNQFRKYPYIYLLKVYKTNKVSGVIDEVVNIKIYFIDRADVNKYSSYTIDNTLENLRTIKDDFLGWVDKNQNIIGDLNYKTNELPFHEDFLKADEFTKMIEVDISSIQMYTRVINC